MLTRTRIKICGVRDVATALAAAEAGADAVGLVFVPPSPRWVERGEAKRIVEALPAFVEPVGLFVDDTATTVLDVAAELGLRTVQLHGHEERGYVERLAPLRVIKALPFTEDAVASLDAWRDPPANLCGLLWDAPPPGGAAVPGGSGHAFDWHGLAALRERGVLDGLPPLLLAGGLTPGNVREAVRTVRPFAVDVSSGVESSRGVKDAARIRAFCDAVREDAQPTGV